MIGKLLGGIFGFLLFGPVGAILGIFLGHFFDKNRLSYVGQNARVQQVFFEALFVTMGKLAKLDGRVSENEIYVARQIMQHMQLTAEQQKQAVAFFNQGKTSGFDTTPFLHKLISVCRYRRNLLHMFMQFLLQAAFADGPPNAAEQQCLLDTATQLGFGQREYQQMFSMFQAQTQFRQQWQSWSQGHQQQYWQQRGQYQQGGQQQSYQSQAASVKQAYAVLGVTEQASMDEVKRAYRKLMNQYHPDKLVAKGLPEEMVKAANEKAQEIRQAYELIKQYKGK